MTRGGGAAAVVGAFLALGLAACAKPGPPNVVVVLVDTLRSDHVGAYGYGRNTTPNLDKIAKEGLLLRNYFVNSPWTKPSVASIMTGLHPTAHGSRTGDFEALKRHDAGKRASKAAEIEVLSPKLDTLAEVLREQGYETRAFVPNYHMTPRFGYSQGYDEYRFEDGVPDASTDRRAMDFCTEALLKAERPVHLWCHLMSVHQYDSPADRPRFKPDAGTPIDRKAAQAWRVKAFGTVEEAEARYDDAIAYDDALIGELYELIRRKQPNTILIVTSDHGEEFFEHGGFEHARTLYNEILRVPFIAHGPGVPAGEIEGITDSIDVLPTVLGLLGAEPRDLPGKAFIHRGRPAGGKDETFSEQHHRGPFRRWAVARRDAKLIVSEPKEGGAHMLELYRDGLGIEAEPSAGTLGETLTWLRRAVRRSRAEAEKRFDETVKSPETAALGASDLRKLRSLGYAQ